MTDIADKYDIRKRITDVPSSVALFNVLGSDLIVVNAARVSFDKESEWDKEEGANRYTKLSDRDQRLIKYLAEHDHWTPFAHCSASFRVKMPIFVARQLIRHTVGFSINEVSRRYVDSPPEYYLPNQFSARPIGGIKQGSDHTNTITTADVDVELSRSGATHYGLSGLLDIYDAVYQRMIDLNISPEQARMFLPLNMMTEWIWSGSLYAWARMCKQRLDTHAQSETTEVAKKISYIMKHHFPVSWRYLVNDQI